MNLRNPVFMLAITVFLKLLSLFWYFFVKIKQLLLLKFFSRPWISLKLRGGFLKLFTGQASYWFLFSLLKLGVFLKILSEFFEWKNLQQQRLFVPPRAQRCPLLSQGSNLVSMFGKIKERTRNSILITKN